jgi:hypothetical protein
MAIVYRHIRLDKNEPFYIGIGNDLYRAYVKNGRNKYWKNIVNKTDYKIEILFNDLSWDEACEKEKEFIKLYGRKDLGLGPLVNMTDGGDGCNNLSYEIKKRISNSKKGNKYWIGKKHKEESKNKISKSKLGHSVNKGKRLGISPVNKKLNINEVNKLINNGLSKKEISILLNCDYGNLCRFIRLNKNKYELL